MKFGEWLRNLGGKISAGMQRFMAGRYGTDKLNLWILGAGVVLCLIAMFVSNTTVCLVLTLVSYGLMIWALFRCMSRNTYKRYRENQRFSRFFERIKDREHRYYTCPKCRQPVRVPRGKGKISIRCPKCGEKFTKKT
ncbi:MAG: hypothetical protein LUJ09_09265 [Firmicutes bacterium]|nr:hypothetical protein [Bacillota bacterium]